MLKIRYHIETRLLSGWGDKNEEIPPRHGEEVVILNGSKPDNDDYENFTVDEIIRSLI